MSKSDSISATSYWSRQKFKFKADAVHDDMSRLNYELMIIAETADSLFLANFFVVQHEK